ncbi:hypothetical protein F9C07_12663 [Aspergillus flavus]|uniref:Uncharacterized protein n=1 Tax=Aspergillus flavus (strain ATCC 200026 / FGSC A1120 / IAM 13836 / NRRL 3357 / JCM 12722 / SRRC 167) TaxID=332952 RepID=A0A7U2MZG8_ASPFN|nr:hypothetical protein F9C07_12663 [Aspergillus flavus]
MNDARESPHNTGLSSVWPIRGTGSSGSVAQDTIYSLTCSSGMTEATEMTTILVGHA